MSSVSLGGSSSRRAWLERISAVLVVGSAVGLWLIDATLLTQLLLWAGWGVGALLLHRLGHLRLFGPVLFYDMIRTARRQRYLLMRTGYAVLLLFILFSTYESVPFANLTSRQREARLASSFFETLMFVQLVAVVLLTPAYLGGAIADEKERRTLEFILATDLRNQEIVLSKLGSRLANLALFLMTALPILSFLQFLGGIDPNLVLMGFAVTGLTMLGTGSVSLLYSVLMRRSRDAIAAIYLFLLLYFVLATLAFGMSMGGNWRRLLDGWLAPPLLGWCADGLAWMTSVLNAGSPLALAIKVAQSGRMGNLAVVLPGLLRDYAAFHIVLAALCLGWSILRLRRLGLKQTVGREITVREARRTLPAVGDHPMLWKERVESYLRLTWRGWLGVIALTCLTLGIGAWIVLDAVATYGISVLWRDPPAGRHLWLSDPLGMSMNIWARIAGGAVACLGLLRAAVRASSAISGERDRQTLDALITTQLSSSSILNAKLLGNLLALRLPFVWLVAILLLASLTRGVHWAALPVTLGAWLLYAACFTMVGLHCSMVCTSTTRAAVAAVMATLGLAVGHWLVWFCLIPCCLGGPGNAKVAELLLKLQFGMSPPCVLVLSMFRSAEVTTSAGPQGFGAWMTFCLFGMMFWGVAAFVFWFGSLCPRFAAIMRREPIVPERRVLAIRQGDVE